MLGPEAPVRRRILAGLEDDAVGEKPTEADEAKTSMQDFEKREAGGLATAEIGNPLEPSGLSSSAGDSTGAPAEATTVKSSKSNSSE
jgi:hypothetical protein